MDSSVDLIEVLSDGKYKLNEDVLQSIVSKADTCDDFALISIIGGKLSGKTLFMNCLINYLESEDKNSWPKDCVLKYKIGFRNKIHSTDPVIQMWSKPFILEADGHKTAVFLMDSRNIFNYYYNKWFSKLVEDLIALILTTSSTVIYTQIYPVNIFISREPC